jgi:hypothetical protein
LRGRRGSSSRSRVCEDRDGRDAGLGRFPQETSDEKTIDKVVLFGGLRGVRLRPNTVGTIRNHLSGRDVIIRVNAVGLSTSGAEGEGRVLAPVLGDSITFGDFVSRGDVARVSRRSRRGGRSGSASERRASASTLEEFYLFQEVKDAVKPDRPRRDVPERRAEREPVLREDSVRPWAGAASTWP